MTENPYSTPTVESRPGIESAVAVDQELSLATIARTVFLAWERLRVVYIAVLGLLTLLLTGPQLIEARTMVMIVEGAVAANVCYFAGPITETYIRWLGYDRGWIRWVLFVGGTLLAAMLALMALATAIIPDQQ